MPTFVVHKHSARNLHYDLRLSMDGVLKSWAVPKEPPRIKGIKRLAIEVEDHELSYAKFEGEIEEGYGKGMVEIWDKGTYKLVDRKPDKIVVEFDGKCLKGKYVLVRLKKSNDGEKKNWLLFKL